MDPDTITTTSFRVLENELTPIVGTIEVSTNGRIATFSPLGLLDYATTYRVDLKNTITPVDTIYTFNGTSFLFDTIEQVTTGIVKGRILDEDGKAFTPSLVKVTLKMGTSTRTATVNNNGNFTFTDVPPGTWTLEVTIKDYDTYSKTVPVTAGGTANTGTKLMGPKDKETDNTWIYVVVGVLLLIFVIVVVYLYMRKRDEEGTEETSGYGGLRRYGGGYGGYDEMAEGEFLCPNCQSVVGPEDEVCGSCGAEFERDIFECPECGTTIPADAPKCPSCGADFQLPEEGEEEEYLDSEEEKEVDVSGDYEVSPLDDEPEYIGMKED
jgi:RNA polymerase subunit RPABC4/transcription elongation factor Spt4